MNEFKKAIEILRHAELHLCSPKYEKELNLAIQALQEKTERENPQPLGLEELEKMNDEPVWMTYFDGSGARWGIVKVTTLGVCSIADCDTSYWFGGVHGPIAYRHKPKHIGGATNMVEYSAQVGEMVEPEWKKRMTHNFTKNH